MSQTIDTSFSAGILEVLPDGVVWVIPVLNNEGAIEDFQIQFANSMAIEATGHPSGGLTGLYIKRDGVPSPEVAKSNFNHFLKVYTSGKKDEFIFYSKYSKLKIEALRTKYQNGVLSVIRDRVALREAEQKEQKTSRILTSIIKNSPNGILVYDAIRNESGTITDFKIRLYNKRSNELTGYSKEERNPGTSGNFI